MEINLSRTRLNHRADQPKYVIPPGWDMYKGDDLVGFVQRHCHFHTEDPADKFSYKHAIINSN